MLPTALPDPTPTPYPPGWHTIGPGIERNELHVPVPGGTGLATVYALRIDPDQVTLHVYYDQETPRHLHDWLGWTGASVVVNGGFFREDYGPVGRVVSEGSTLGVPFDPGGLMGLPGLLVDMDGQVSVLAADDPAYAQPGPGVDEAVEGYPLLVQAGAAIFPKDTGRLARRTVIGLDREGRILVLVADSPVFSLYVLGEWLAQSKLEPDVALNLDGGRSTGIAVSLPGETLTIESYVPVPGVIAFFPEQ
jgi:uncharacterized protein YigE (DUF2233 family)